MLNNILILLFALNLLILNILHKYIDINYNKTAPTKVVNFVTETNVLIYKDTI